VVLDFGTLEHVFNVPVAFDNVAALCAPGAHILHVLPCNNLSGHGFYQFSPELFFQIYSDARGYAGTRVFAAPGGTPDTWYEVGSPRELGARLNLTSRDQLYLLVLTQKVGEQTPLAERPVQQSDYVQLWAKEPRRTARQRAHSSLEQWLRAAFLGARHRRKVAQRDISARRTDVRPCQVRALTAKF
jgi:hypothetical protein